MNTVTFQTLQSSVLPSMSKQAVVHSSQLRYSQLSLKLPPYLHQQAIENPLPRRSQPAQSGVDRFGPPTLERSGSEHRVGRFPSSSLRGEDRDERWSLL